jgi:hypothetical protein
MTSPKVNFKGWAEAVASVDPSCPPKPGYKRADALAKELGLTYSKTRHNLARLHKAGAVDLIELNGRKWYKLK